MTYLLLLASLAVAVPGVDQKPTAGTNAPVVRDATPYEALIIDARESQRKGLLGAAIKKLDSAIALNPKRLDAYFFKGQILSLERKPLEAVGAFSKVIEMDPKASTAYRMRAEEEFRSGKVDQSVADFDKYVALEPRGEAFLWQRGIAFYEAGKFDEGRKQFELHQTVNPNDVENGVWHFLCVARASGFEKARSSMIPISGDARVPMKEVYDLFAGKGSVDDVFKAVKKGEPTPVDLENRRFYAELYLGLYFEAKGDSKQAYEHLKSAASDFKADDYMGDVARIHFQRVLSKGSSGK